MRETTAVMVKLGSFMLFGFALCCLLHCGGSNITPHTLKLPHIEGFDWRLGYCSGYYYSSKIVTIAACASECLKTAKCLLFVYRTFDSRCFLQYRVCTTPYTSAWDHTFFKVKWPAVSYNVLSPHIKSVNLAYHRTGATYKVYNLRSGAWAALDGYREPYVSYKSCAIGGTNFGTDIFLYVDLLASYEIGRIIITNRLNYAQRGKDLTMVATDMFYAHDTRKGNQTVCARQTEQLAAGIVTQYRCPRGVKGRYAVILRYPANDYLQICEFEVYTPNTFENLALHKPASFSHQPAKPASYAVDGHLRVSTTLTPGCAVNENRNLNKQEWWAVDLQQLYHVRSIYVTTAGVAKTLAMNKLKIAVQKKFQNGQLISDFVICNTVSTAWNAKTTNLNRCKYRTIGRYVVIQKDNTGATTIVPLTLCEVEVFGDVPRENLAFKKPTSMSSGGKLNQMANDGATDPAANQCFVSPKKANDEWWSVDLLDDYIVRTVTLFFTPDQSQISVFVTAGTVRQLCYKQTAKIAAGFTHPIHCSRMLVGNSITIVKHTSLSAALILCEVEVYGDIYNGNIALGKTTSQSTTYWKYSADLANDGFSFSAMSEGSCSQTLSLQMDDPNRPNWWSMDLGEVRSVYNMKIVNSNNCGTNCLRDFKVLLSDKFDKTNFHVNKFQVCYDDPVSLQGGAVFPFHCQKLMSARHVTIKGSSGYQLTLCEVMVYDVNYLVNIAMNKPVESSPEDVKNPAYRATDGQTDGKMSAKACSATCGWDKEEWISIDLRARYRVWKVVVHSKIDRAGTGLQDFDVHVAEKFVSDSFFNSPHNSAICHSQKNELDIGSHELRCKGAANGRYVVFWKDNKSKTPLVLCEVEVFGTLLQDGFSNVAAGKTVTLSDKGIGSRATNGQTYPNDVLGCTTTSGALDTEWLAVDLSKTHEVTGAGIVNRHSCCNKAQLGDIELIMTRDLHIDDVRKGAFYHCTQRTRPMGKGKIMNLPCTRPVKGRYFIVIKNKAKTTPLVICEIEVYGKALGGSTDVQQNLALKQKATQSSEVSKTIRTASKANDGNLKPDIAGGACAKTTGNQAFEWWSVSLNDTYEIESVAIVADATYNNLTILVAYDDFEPRDLNLNFTGAFVPGNYVYGPASPPTTSAAPTTTGSAAAGTTGASTSTVAPTTAMYVPVTTFSVCGTMTFTAKLGEIRVMDCKGGTVGKHIIVVKDKAKGKPLIVCEFQAYGKVPVVTTTSSPITSSTTATTSTTTTTTTTTTTVAGTVPSGEGSGQAVSTSVNKMVMLMLLTVACSFGCRHGRI